MKSIKSKQNYRELENGFAYYENGWNYYQIHGPPKKRGYAYGCFCVEDFKEIQAMLKFKSMESFGLEWSFFIEKISNDFQDLIKTKFNEFYQEMEGIVEGLNAHGCETTIEEIIAWNFYLSLRYWYSSISDNHVSKEGGADDKCSAFIATGSWTEDGGIVVAHNSFTEYVDGQWSNVVLTIIPENGHKFIMQTAPCMIWSGTDFFVTSKGIIGTETTIGGFFPYEKRNPVFCNIRQAMQYGNSLDDYCEILLNENSGDYANSWLFGDINTNEILRLVLGLKYHAIERTKDGYFIGFNAPYDERIRNLEVINSGFYDIRRHQGARLVRLGDLMDTYKGKLNIETAKLIIADHYDVYLEKENPCSRTVCSHYDLDAREYMSQSDRPKPYAPRGAIDGALCTSKLASEMSFIVRYGNSCGLDFNSNEFFNKHRQYYKFQPYVKSRPSQIWTLFSIIDKNSNKLGTSETLEILETSKKTLKSKNRLKFFKKSKSKKI